MGTAMQPTVTPFYHRPTGTWSYVVADPATPVLWRAIVHDGALVAGSGSDGKVFRVTRDGKAALLVDTEQLQVHALAAAPGAAPSGGERGGVVGHRLVGVPKSTLCRNLGVPPRVTPPAPTARPPPAAFWSRGS